MMSSISSGVSGLASIGRDAAVHTQRGGRASDEKQVAAVDFEEPFEPALQAAGIRGRRVARSDGVQFVDDAIEIVCVHDEGSIGPAVSTS